MFWNARKCICENFSAIVIINKKKYFYTNIFTLSITLLEVCVFWMASRPKGGGVVFLALFFVSFVSF